MLIDTARSAKPTESERGVGHRLAEHDVDLDRAAYALGIAAFGFEEAAQLAPPPGELGGPQIGSLPAIGQSGHQSQCQFTHGRDPHWRPGTLHRGRPSYRADEVAEPPVALDGSALPESAYHLDCFRETVHALGPRRIRNAVTLPQVPGRVVVGSDAQPQIE